MSISKRKLPSGVMKWQSAYRDQAGKRRHKLFSTKREADVFDLKARNEVAAGIHTPDSISITVCDAADQWLERCEREGLELSTQRQYKNHVELHIKPFIGGMKISRLSAPGVNIYLADLQSAGRSKEMARRCRRSLSAIIKYAQSIGQIGANNVAASTPIRRSKRENVRVEMPTIAELKAIIKATPGRHLPFILTAMLTGLRGSELRGLTWEHVDLAKALVLVRQRADEGNKFGAPKSEKGTRDIPIAPVLVDVLRDWRQACPKGRLDLVFPTGAGNVESHANLLNRVFWPAQVTAGVTSIQNGEPDAKYSLHALRHAAAALFIAQGFGPKKVQAFMGHASIQQTFDQYGYLFESDEDDQKAVAEIAERLVGKNPTFISLSNTPPTDADAV